MLYHMQHFKKCYGSTFSGYMSVFTQIRTCSVFLDHLQNLHIHAVRAKILVSIFGLRAAPMEGFDLRSDRISDRCDRYSQIYYSCIYY